LAAAAAALIAQQTRVLQVGLAVVVVHQPQVAQELLGRVIQEVPAGLLLVVAVAVLVPQVVLVVA
jgi:hypothetical protein